MTFEDTPPQAGNVPSEPESRPAAAGVAALFLGAILAGASLGLAAPHIGEVASRGVDATLLVMICLIFFDLRLGAIFKAIGNLRFLALAWGANFLIVPVLGFAIASLVLPNQPLLFAGLMIYFLAPCTDWFLGFTQMADGDTELGAALIPVNLITQLLVFPVWIWLFTQHAGLVDIATIPGIIAQWFLLPLIAAQALRIGLEKVVPREAFDTLLEWTGRLVPFVIAVLIFQIFAANTGLITDHLRSFLLISLAVFLFFTATFFVGEVLSRLAGLAYPQRALLAMTMAARNAPMMLVVTAAAVPDQPLILAALVIGMLIEIPHLTALRQVLLARRDFRPKLS